MWSGKKLFNLFSTPAHFASLLLRESMWGFQDIFSFSWSPRRLKFFTLSKGMPSISKSGITPSILLFMAWKITYLVFLLFRDNLLTASQSALIKSIKIASVICFSSMSLRTLSVNSMAANSVEWSFKKPILAIIEQIVISKIIIKLRKDNLFKTFWDGGW